MTNTSPSNGSKIRCAIYTRKSCEDGLELEFNSLHAQRESAEAFIASQQHEGWVCLPDRYDDGGFSGGNLDRPALNQLLEDIQAGKVDCVVVYRVDRLSRSLLDFSRIMETFDKNDREVPYLHQKQIERAARLLLEEYEIKFGQKPTAPIPIERITEIQLQLTLEFKDMKLLFPFADVHGAIWFDEGIIGIDQSLDPDINPPMLGRYHFTLAHEIGHWCLHRKLYKENPNRPRMFDDGARRPLWQATGSNGV